MPILYANNDSLRKFLLSVGAYKWFYRNLQISEYHNQALAIFLAFDWSTTPEGWKYWDSVNIRYLEFLEKSEKTEEVVYIDYVDDHTLQDFLKIQGATSLFTAHLTSRSYPAGQPEMAIHHAFDWKNTQNPEYWQDLSEIYRRYLQIRCKPSQKPTKPRHKPLTGRLFHNSVKFW